jgi:short-chain fatty acids transporter
MTQVESTAAESRLAQLGLRLSDWFERWFPDAFALALTAVAIVFLATLANGATPAQSAQWVGSGFWDLVAFTMQMSMIIITGYAVATSAPVYAVIRRMASVPKTGRGAAACPTQ